MANPTTNYGFVMPTSTDLVTDLPADFDVFGQAVDTQMLTNANAAIAKTIVDAKGDIIAATAADTVSRLAVGANDTVLTADSAQATGLKWAAVSASSMTLLSTTSLSGTSTTISSISGAYTNLLIIAKDVDTGTSNGNINLRFNGDSGSNYRNVGYTGSGTTNVVFMNTNTFTPGTDMRTGGDPGNFAINLYRYTDTAKIQGNLAWDLNSTTERYAGRADFRYDAAAAITSFTVTNSNALSMTGTIYIYGVK